MSHRIVERLAVCKGQLTKWQLFSALIAHGDARLISINDITCYIQSIGREDGSGSSFYLKVGHGGHDYSVYCRTID